MPQRLNGPNDYLVSSDAALANPDTYLRAEELGNLLEQATNARRESGDPSGDYGRVIAILRARVSRAIEELRVFVQGPENPTRRHIDVEALVQRLETIRLARTDPKN